LRRRSTDRAITNAFVITVCRRIGFICTERSAVIVRCTFGIGFVCGDTAACCRAGIYR
jgi:hypothetical protein